MTGRGGIAAAAVLSLTLHLAGAGLVGGAQVPAIEGAASSEPVRLGTGFEDVAAGAIPAAPAPEPVAHDTPTITAATPVAATVAAAPRPTATRAHTSSATPAAASAPVRHAAPPATTAPTVAMPAGETPHAADAHALAPPTALTTATAVPALPAVTASAPAETALDASPRPVPRPERVPERPPQRAAASNAPGAQRNERRGQADGVEAATAAEAPNPAAERRAAPQAGNATASSYPGLVMRKLSRTSRPSAGRRGSAIVGFEVGAGGELRRVLILRSSGHESVDRAAMDHVSRAAPFPPPPEAQVRFQVAYESRG
jgi:periplasmic protein TonB